MPTAPVVLPLAEWIDPETAYLAWLVEEPLSMWLDAGVDAREGWSFLGVGSETSSDEAVRGFSRDAGCSAPRGAEYAPDHAPPPFCGGWVGWCGYETGALRAGAPVAEPEAGIPPSLWIRVDRIIAFDHAAKRAWVVAPTRAEAEALADLAVNAPRHPVPIHQRPERADARARHTPAEYAANIERYRESIRRGDAYQLCATTRFEVEGPHDPVMTYRVLRRASRAPSGGLIRAGEAALASASPEQFLRVHGKNVRTSPIKGTRPRGRTPSEDAALIEELRTSVKERAENVMIVDLMRNDLSRICAPGSVYVDALFEVRSFPQVHQLVSTVSGQLRPGVSVGNILDATFPAGSMTGAPKLSAMSILHQVEQHPRGVFSGCFGWVAEDGSLDLAMVIRSILIHPGGAYVGAGGGITWLSVPEEETAEVGWKARAPLEALGARLPEAWR